MTVQVTIVGGGSAQWTPILVEDFANTPCLRGMRLVLHDIDRARVEATAAHARHVAAAADTGWVVDATTEQSEALAGSAFVVVCISTGGLAAMAQDLELAGGHGVPMPIGDTIGPAGISRAWRNVPAMLDIARTVERLAPSAWLLNVTNPLTTLTRTIARETSVRTVGLCHEVTNTTFFLSQLLDCGFFDLDVSVTGVNHLPLITAVRVNGEDRWDQLLDLAHGRAETCAPLPLLDRIMAQPRVTTGGAGRTRGPDDGHWTKQSVIDSQALNYEILRRFGALPGADSDHTSEFFAGFVRTEEEARTRWGIDLVTVAAREAREAQYVAELERKTQAPRITAHRSPEMVAPVIESLLADTPCVMPLNIPNDGQCPDISGGRIVESMCVVDGGGIAGRDIAYAPAPLNEWLRRVTESQELTVQAAVEGDRATLLAALFTDPATSRLAYDDVVTLRDEIVAANARWRPTG